MAERQLTERYKDMINAHVLVMLLEKSSFTSVVYVLYFKLANTYYFRFRDRRT